MQPDRNHLDSEIVIYTSSGNAALARSFLQWRETMQLGKALVPRNIPRSLALEHNNKQAVFGFSQRKCLWPAVIRRKFSEMHVIPKEVLFGEYLVISSKLLPNSFTAYNFYVNSAH